MGRECASRRVGEASLATVQYLARVYFWDLVLVGVGPAARLLLTLQHQDLTLRLRCAWADHLSDRRSSKSGLLAGTDRDGCDPSEHWTGLAQRVRYLPSRTRPGSEPAWGAQFDAELEAIFPDVARHAPPTEPAIDGTESSTAPSQIEDSPRHEPRNEIRVDAKLGIATLVAPGAAERNLSVAGLADALAGSWITVAQRGAGKAGAFWFVRHERHWRPSTRFSGRRRGDRRPWLPNSCHNRWGPCARGPLGAAPPLAEWMRRQGSDSGALPPETASDSVISEEVRTMTANELPPFSIELVLSTGDHILGDLGPDDIVRNQVGMPGNITFREEPSDHRDRAMNILVLAMDYHLERDGEFGMSDREGRYWLVRTRNILAVALHDRTGARAPRAIGFAQRDSKAKARCA